MKKFFKFLAILIGIVVIGILVLGVIEPQDVTVRRSILMHAAKDSVFEQIVKFRNWPDWSPWQKLDTGMKITYTGDEGQPGSGYHWAGDENKVGEGEMKTTDVQGTRMQYEMHVIKPWSLDATCMLEVKDTANDQVKVTWTLKKHTPYPFNAAGMFIDFDKLLGADFETGLQNMKKYTEAHSPFVEKVDIKEVDYPAHVYEGIRKVVYWNDMAKFFNDGYLLVDKDVEGKISGFPVGIFYNWDTVNKSADVATAFPVVDTTAPIKGTSFFHIGPAKAYLAVEKGGYSKSKLIHDALARYAADKGQIVTLKIEEYQVGPKQDTNSNHWVTNVYYLVQ